jgi:hypothetical protein
MAAHGIMAVLIMFILDTMQGLMELILILILWCAAKRLDFCNLIFYMIFTLLSFIQNGCLLGLQIQEGTFVLAMNLGGMPAFKMVFLIILVLFYVAANIVAFLAYKEFKGMSVD